jgi:glutathione S-transferase
MLAMPSRPLLYDFPTSPFCAKVRAALNLQGIDFDSVDASTPRAWWRLQREGGGKVPALALDGEWIGDSTAIALALHARHPGQPLLPAAPRERGLCLALNTGCEAALYPLGLHLHWLDDAHALAVRRRFPRGPLGALMWRGYRLRIARQLGAQGLGQTSTARVQAALAQQLDTVVDLLGDAPFLLGERAWLCDLALFGQLRFLALAPGAQAALAARPLLHDYTARVKAAVGWRSAMRAAPSNPAR